MPGPVDLRKFKQGLVTQPGPFIDINAILFRAPLNGLCEKEMVSHAWISFVVFVVLWTVPRFCR